MVTPVVAGSGEHRRFFWNVSANVGVNSPNMPDDVQLVQFAYALTAAETYYDAALRAIFATVVRGVA